MHIARAQGQRSLISMSLAVFTYPSPYLYIRRSIYVSHYLHIPRRICIIYPSEHINIIYILRSINNNSIIMPCT